MTRSDHGNTRKALLCGSLLLAVSGALGSALADTVPTAPPAFEQGYQALQRGALDEAIDSFELLADQGFTHPDASFDRAAAYLARARSSDAKPGDLGRAVAALSETLLLRPSDAAAERALDQVQRELARRRARQGSADIASRPSLGRALTGLLSANGWALLAVTGSALLTLGLALRRLLTHSSARLTGAVAGGLGVALLGVGALFTERALALNAQSRPAVVVATEAPLLGENGTPISGGPNSAARAVPEGAEVFVVAQQGPLAQIEWGAIEGWVNVGQLRLLGAAR